MKQAMRSLVLLYLAFVVAIKAQYKLWQESQCNGDMIDLDGLPKNSYVSINSPKAEGEFYGNNVTCAYKFMIPPNMNVVLNIKRMQVKGGKDGQCKADRLIIDTEDEKEKLCGFFFNRKVEKGYKGRHWKLTATFKTNGQNVGKGFYIRVFLAKATTLGSSKCGVARELAGRVVGGSEVEAYSIPWQVGLVKKDQKIPFCGGTLIGENHVLTAAHCMIGETADGIQVLVGEHNHQDTVMDGVAHDVKCISNHPKFNNRTFKNDYAVVVMAKPVDIMSSSSNARAACLPMKNLRFAGKTVTVSGWGKTSETAKDKSVVLKSANVKAISNKKCKQYYGDKLKFKMACAGNVDTAVNTCQGDGGGPLTVEVKGLTYVVGVVSLRENCAKKGVPGIYSRVTSEVDWILKHGIYNGTTSCNV